MNPLYHPLFSSSLTAEKESTDLPRNVVALILVGKLAVNVVAGARLCRTQCHAHQCPGICTANMMQFICIVGIPLYKVADKELVSYDAAVQCKLRAFSSHFNSIDFKLQGTW